MGKFTRNSLLLDMGVPIRSVLGTAGTTLALALRESLNVETV